LVLPRRKRFSYANIAVTLALVLAISGGQSLSDQLDKQFFCELRGTLDVAA
jgi:hypothetical protein